MTMQWIVFLVLVAGAATFLDNQKRAQQASDQASLDSLSRRFLIYRSAAGEFAKFHLAFNGTPDDSALDLPTWLVKPPGVTSYVVAGKAYTYLSGDFPAALPSALVDLTESIAVGTNRSGMLVSPSLESTGITVPAAVPEGAVVAVN